MDKTYDYPCGCSLSSWSEGYVRTKLCSNHDGSVDIKYKCGCHIHHYQKGSAHFNICFTHKIKDEIYDDRKKIKALEEWKHQFINDDLTKLYSEFKDVRSDVKNYLIARIENLEQWKCDAKLATAPVLLDRIMALERTMSNAYISDIPPRLKALEEWKQKEDVYAGFMGPPIKDHHVRLLEDRTSNIAQRVKELESWVSDQFPQCNYCGKTRGSGLSCKHCDRIPSFNPCPSDTKTIPQEFKALSQQTWNDLKRYVSNMHHHEAIPWTYKEAFEEIIRRIEPNWKP